MDRVGGWWNGSWEDLAELLVKVLHNAQRVDFEQAVCAQLLDASGME